MANKGKTLIRKPKRYTELSSNDLHNRLHKRNLPPNIINQIKEQVALKKKLINTARVESKIRMKRWAKLIEPLTKEIKSVRANMKYHEQHNPELHIFFTDYLDLLQQTRGILTTRKLNRETTPTNYDRTKRHWSDHINPELRKDYTHRYHNIPYASKHSSRREIFK
jgi:hypothetical protein